MLDSPRGKNEGTYVPKWGGRRRARYGVVLRLPPQLFFNEIAGLETSSQLYLLKYGASCHHDFIV